VLSLSKYGGLRIVTLRRAQGKLKAPSFLSVAPAFGGVYPESASRWMKGSGHGSAVRIFLTNHQLPVTNHQLTSAAPS
jgi:hypothetical protein